MYIQLFTYIHAHTIMYTQLNMCRHVCIHNNIQCMSGGGAVMVGVDVVGVVVLGCGGGGHGGGVVVLL